MTQAPLGIAGLGFAAGLGWMFFEAEKRRWRREYAERRLAYDRLRKHGCPALEAMRVSQCSWAAEAARRDWVTADRPALVGLSSTAFAVASLQDDFADRALVVDPGR